jgi:cytoskeletal protein RodZ
VAAIVLGVLLVAFVFVSQLFADNLGLDAAQSAKLDGRALIGAQVIGPVTVVGVAVTLIGVWMAATEWRGRFAAPADTTGEREIADPTKIVEALGKLRGAALVLVSGVVILLGVAWMTSATASAPPAPTPSSTSTPTANPTT